MKIQYGTSMVCDYHLFDITQDKYQELNYIKIENAFVNQISNKSAHHNVMEKQEIGFKLFISVHTSVHTRHF